MQPIGLADLVKTFTRGNCMNSPIESLLPADQLPAKIAQFLKPELPPLGPGRPHEALADQLAGLDKATFGCAEAAGSAELSACCLAGLWLWNGFLDESHALSQAIHTAEGSWWHGIMHRREPDPGNAKYWFRQIGDHRLAGPLATRVRQTVAGGEVPAQADWLQTLDRWDAHRFVDLCEAARGRRDRLEQLAREVAAIEWFSLFEYCRTGNLP